MAGRSIWNGTAVFAEDCHRSRLLKIIRAKRRTGEVNSPDVEPEHGPVPDLMVALRESLARVKQQV